LADVLGSGAAGVDAVVVVVDASVRDLGFSGVVALEVRLAESIGRGLAASLELEAFARSVAERREGAVVRARGNHGQRAEDQSKDRLEGVFQGKLSVRGDLHEA
jgi:hypothetical protein